MKCFHVIILLFCQLCSYFVLAQDPYEQLSASFDFLPEKELIAKAHVQKMVINHHITNDTSGAEVKNTLVSVLFFDDRGNIISYQENVDNANISTYVYDKNNNLLRHLDTDLGGRPSSVYRYKYVYDHKLNLISQKSVCSVFSNRLMKFRQMENRIFYDSLNRILLDDSSFKIGLRTTKKYEYEQSGDTAIVKETYINRTKYSGQSETTDTTFSTLLKVVNEQGQLTKTIGKNSIDDEPSKYKAYHTNSYIYDSEKRLKEWLSEARNSTRLHTYSYAHDGSEKTIVAKSLFKEGQEIDADAHLSKEKTPYNEYGLPVKVLFDNYKQDVHYVTVIEYEY